jgi:hypothetical protein
LLTIISVGQFIVFGAEAGDEGVIGRVVIGKAVAAAANQADRGTTGMRSKSRYCAAWRRKAVPSSPVKAI